MEWIVSPYFTKLEMQCKDGCGTLPTPNFMRKLNTLREVANFPFRVSSCARCAAHNTAVGGGRNSPHVLRRGIDILISGEKAFILVKLAIHHGFTGIGISQKGEISKRFIHLDDLESDSLHPRPLIWSY